MVKVTQSHLVDLLVHVYINERLEASRIFTKNTAIQHLFEGRQINLDTLERFRFKNYFSGQITIKLYPGVMMQEAKQVEQSVPDGDDIIALRNQRCFDFKVASREPVQEITIPLGTAVREYSGYQVHDTFHYNEEDQENKKGDGFKIRVKNPYKK